MTRIETDLCILGGGSGGLAIAAGAAQMGAEVVLLEGHKMGGDCLNYGCVPSKALLAEGKRARAGQEVAFKRAKDHVADVIATIEPHDSVERFEGLGVRVIREYGRFISPTEVQAGDTVIAARRFVIATGSGPLVPPIDGIEDVTVHTNETIFELQERPEHLLVIGGGPIGMEMAQAHRRLGCKVTVIEGAKALGKDDPDLAAIVLDKLRGEGIEIIEGAQARQVSQADGRITVHTDQGAVTGSHLLMAVGRKVNVAGLDLDAAGVDWDKSGVKVSDTLRSTSNRRVYAVGDAAGGMQFTHVAGYHAGIVIRSALLGLPAKQTTRHIPWTTYTDPEMAQVGLTEVQARETHGDRLEVAEAEFAGNDRAVAEGKTTGRIKIMVVRGRPVGATIVGPMAGELIAMWAMAIANKLKMSAISNTVLPYPTFSEINKRAAGNYFAPRLFESDTVKRVVRLVQKYLP
ncbi:dihydrolipoyl dehydrogenase family protein [Salibaculum halophilum]|uniref:dihydrolipoyl dehydrogenase family protein n=1 Tax=Salibaculum halophilum TaxID=1914408 RepID=UPI000A1132B7|nr:FAD-dependent oxidoreductase [Salibaculum halophilum]